MAIDLDISPKFSSLVDRARLRHVALKVFAAEHVPEEQGLTIVIRGDAAVRKLNRRHLKIDAPTDVLSFTTGQKGYLGDIIISYETARRNARIFRWSVRDELDLLVVHGILHLLGYDDSGKQAKSRMWQRQEELLGVPVNDVPSNRRRGRSLSMLP